MTAFPMKRTVLRRLKPADLAMAIRRFGAKARCAHSQRSAHNAWNDLVGYGVSEKDLARLMVAWSHAKAEEGPAELDALVKELTAAYPSNILRKR